MQRLRRWSTNVDLPEGWTIQKVRQRFRGLEIFLNDSHGWSVAKLTFGDFLAHRSLDANLHHETLREDAPDDPVGLWIVEDSKWVASLSAESGAHLAEDLVHYALSTREGGLDVLSRHPPLVEGVDAAEDWIDARREAPKFVELFFEYGFTERDEFEAEARGYRSHVWVVLDDGSRHPVTFYDLVRLSQEFESECEHGREFFGEPGLILVKHVTRAHMEAAARKLAAEGFFDP